MKFSLVLLLILIVSPDPKIKVWKEKRGLVVVEAEHSQERNDLPIYWASSTVVQGYSGTGFLRWSGTSFINKEFSEIDYERIITYYVDIDKEGVYYMKIKGTIFDEPSANILVRIDNSEWKQFIIPNNGSVAWDINPLEESYPFFFQHDFHKIDIAGTSSGFLFDKFALLHESLIDPAADSINTKLLDYQRESRSQYLPADQFKFLNEQ